MKKLFVFIFIISTIFISCGKNNNDSTVKESEQYLITQEFSTHLKGSGKIKLKLKEPIDENFIEKIEKTYLRLAEENNSKELSDEDVINSEKIFISPINIVMDSDLVDIKAGEKKSYEIILESKENKKIAYKLNIENIRPNNFTIRLLNKDGVVQKEKTYTYDEMKALAKNEAFYSGGCVMHGLINFKGRGIYLKDLFKDAGFEFKEGMSLACRVVDAETEIEATERNSSKKTGEVFKNPEKYWIKPRYTDNFKHSYENLYNRDRYFVVAQWEDEEIGKILAEDEGKYSFNAREALAKNKDFLIKVEPMIALEATSLQYNKNKADIRTFGDEKYGLFAEEIGFRFLYGAALDNDPVENVTAYDKEKNEYPVIKTPENAGKKAIEEGDDACGTSARQAKYVFGIDIFLEN